MAYPLISEYIESIKMAEDNFATLTNLRPVLDDNGEPIMSGGNFAVVFKMEDIRNNRLYAIKCFTKDQEGRENAYRLISDEMMTCNKNSYILDFKYLRKELFVDSNVTLETEFPIVKMEWVDGLTLDLYIKKHSRDEILLSQLTYNFSQLAFWLANQPFAHGDLKPDNIIVKDNTDIVLVDYDGMFVTGMKGQCAREIGSPNFQHPERTTNIYNERIDDLALISILLSIKIATVDFDFYTKYSSNERLFFSKNDYVDPSNSIVLRELSTICKDNEFCRLFGIFMFILATNDLSLIKTSKLLCLESKQTINDWLHYYHGVELLQDKEYYKAFNVFQFILDDDSKFKQNALGYCYANGFAVEKNYTKAAELFMKSAKQGFWPAMTNIGHCYQHGFGIEKNKEKASYWVNKCNALGVGPCQKVFDSVMSLDGAWGDGLLSKKQIKELQQSEWVEYYNVTTKKFFLGVKNL